MTLKKRHFCLFSHSHTPEIKFGINVTFLTSSRTVLNLKKSELVSGKHGLVRYRTLSCLQVEDSEDVLRENCARLAAAIRDAQHVVVYTGAGISTVGFVTA